MKGTKILIVCIAAVLCGIGVLLFFLFGMNHEQPIAQNQVLYTINADGKTCTIIDIGTFQGSNLEIPETIDDYQVTAIGAYAFSKNRKLESVTIPEGITTIGKEAFSGCESLTSVTLPESLTNFDGAFSNCTALTQINIPSGITSIGNRTFYNCGLSAVSIPDGVTSIGVNAFYGCPLTAVYIPDSVTAIEFGAFSGCKELKELRLPGEIEIIPEALLKGCISLESIVIPQGVTKIGPEAFSNCTSINSFSIPESVLFIGERAFYRTGYESNSDNWDGDDLYIGDWLVQTYSSKSEYTFASKAKMVAVLPFSRYESFYVEDGHPTLSAVDGVLYSKDMTELIAFPGYWGSNWDRYYTVTFQIPDGVERIRDYAFYETVTGDDHSPFLKKIVMSNSVKSIGDYAFYMCTGLESIALNDGITDIGESAFRSCWSVKDLRLPKGVTVIRDYVFNGCDIEQIDLHEGITSIGEGAFYDCKLISVSIPQGIKKIEDYAFCSNQLTNVIIPEGVTYIGNYAFSNSGAPKGMFGSEGETDVPDYANSAINIPASVTEIGISALKAFAQINIDSNNQHFTAEDGLLYNKDKTLLISCYFGKTNASVADSVKKIHMLAFAGCEKLTAVKLPNGLTTLGDGSFMSCLSLKNVELPESLMHIQSSSFYNCSALTDIKIPASVRSMGYGVFLYCSSLEKISISGDMEYIGSRVFDGCKNLKKLTVGGSQLVIDDYAFSGVYSLKELKLEDGVSSIGEGFLKDCEYLSSIHIPETVTQIDPKAFSGSWITTLTVDKSNDCYITKDNVLYDKKMTKLIWRSPNSKDVLTLPVSVTCIETEALCGYREREITIPVTVTEIGDYAFSYSNIVDIHYGGTKEQWNALMAGKSLCSFNMVQATIHCTDGDIPNFRYGE